MKKRKLAIVVFLAFVVISPLILYSYLIYFPKLINEASSTQLESWTLDDQGYMKYWGGSSKQGPYHCVVRDYETAFELTSFMTIYRSADNTVVGTFPFRPEAQSSSTTEFLKTRGIAISLIYSWVLLFLAYFILRANPRWGQREIRF